MNVSSPEDVSAGQPDRRVEDAGVQVEDRVALELSARGRRLLQPATHVREGLVHPCGHLARLCDDGAADGGGGDEDDLLVGEAEAAGARVVA